MIQDSAMGQVMRAKISKLIAVNSGRVDVIHLGQRALVTGPHRFTFAAGFCNTGPLD